MFKVFLHQFNRWLFDVPVSEALIYKEEGYEVYRME